MSREDDYIQRVQHERDTAVRRADLPGSDGEHILQTRFGTEDRADAFYESSMQSALTDRMASFLADRWFGIVGSLVDGQPLAVPCVGVPGMIEVLDSDLIAWPAEVMHGPGIPLTGPPEERGLSLTTVDWWNSTVGLHVNGTANRLPHLPAGTNDSTSSKDWYVLSIEEAYIHCAKHIPRLAVDGPIPAGRPPGAPQRRNGRGLSGIVEFVKSRVSGTLAALESGGETYVSSQLDREEKQFIDSQILFFLTTADTHGETDVSPRLGPPGFVQVLDSTTLAWPEYRGNAIHASLGNIYERSSASLLFVDWWSTEATVHVSGEASLHDEVDGAVDLTDVDRTKAWVVVDVESVTVSLDPPLPKVSIEEFDPPWGTDDPDVKKTGFFTA